MLKPDDPVFLQGKRAQEWVVRSVWEECAAYLRQLDERKIPCRIVEEAAQADGSILLKIKRQNNQYDVGTYLDE